MICVGFDFEEARRKTNEIARLRSEGKCCPKCSEYNLYENPSKGSCKGWCSLKKDRNPDKPKWWQVAQNEVCDEYQEK